MAPRLRPRRSRAFRFEEPTLPPTSSRAINQFVFVSASIRYRRRDTPAEFVLLATAPSWITAHGALQDSPAGWEGLALAFPKWPRVAKWLEFPLQ